MTSSETVWVPKHLVALAQQVAAPQLTESALERRFGPRSTWAPAPGQIWRALRDDIGLLVLLLAVDADSVTAVPVTVEPITENPGSMLIEGEVTSLNSPVTVWPGLCRELPISLLDRPVDDVGTAARQVADRVARPQKVSEAASPLSADPDVSEARAALEDDLAAMTEVTATEVETTEAETAGGINIDALAPETLDEAATRLGAPLPVVLDLIDGKRAPTPQEAVIMREVFGAAPTATPPPLGLVTEFNQPRWRGLVRQRKRRDELTDSEARLALAYEVSAMAARQTGDQAPSWPDRIRRWAEAHQLDPDAAE
ncbi:hypothetical protein ABGB17_17485 [Sphaerisporangium sp. B11E5]|uniref:hypothetical protein n=1 Tax=Sphaerisporangium sp. B11E5 TaxID=3153563 RepID=UPI00325E9356